MSNNQTANPVKKRRSFWWLWLILILVAFAGGIILGLKLNTLPLPMQVKDKLYPVIESYIPGGTASHTPTATPAVTPEMTAAPETTTAPETIAAPEMTAVPEMTAAPAAEPAAVPEATPIPTLEPIATLEPVMTEDASTVKLSAEESIPAVEATPVPENTTEVNLGVSETAAFASDAPAPAKYIGVDAALQIALAHAGLKENEVEVGGVLRTKNQDGESVYEVSFQVGEVSHDYVIDAFSGEILGWMLSGLSTSETLTFAADFQGNDRTEAAAAAPEMISEERAKEIAYTHAGVKEADVLRSTVELDQTNDKASYHVVFRITDRRFDYSIDAGTGEILSFELR